MIRIHPSRETASLALALIILIGALWLGSPLAYVPHVDDLFAAEWARAALGPNPTDVPAIAPFLTAPDWLALGIKGHVYALGLAFEAFGVSTMTATVFRGATYVIGATVVGLYCLRRGWTLAGPAFAAFLLLVLLHAGIRFELTALVLMLSGLIGVLMAPATRGRAALRALAKIAIVLAPLAAPSALVYGLAAFVMAFLRDAIMARKPWVILEDVAAGIVGLVAWGLMVDFRYLEFIAFFRSLVADTPLFTFALDRLATGLILIGLSIPAWRRSPEAGFIAAVVGLGNLFALIGHSKMPMATSMLSLAILVLIEALAPEGKRRRFARMGLIVTLIVLFANQTVFAIFSNRDAASLRVAADRARADRDAGKHVLIDEVTAFHALDLDTRGMGGWTWSRRFPLNRPADINEITANETWIVSAYTIHGWLKSTRVAGFPGRDAPLAARFPPIGCWFGRNSCDFPTSKWGFYIVTRNETGVVIETVPSR